MSDGSDDSPRASLAHPGAAWLPPILERLLDASTDGILAFDTELRYTVWNAAMERISGLTEARVVGQRALDIFPFLVETGEDRHFYEVLAGRESVSRDRPFTIPETGRTGFFEGHYAPIHGANREVVGGLGIIRDITARRRDEAERIEAVRLAVAEASAERFAFLAKAGEALSSSLDYQQTLTDVARLAVPILGDLCIVDIAHADGTTRVAATHVIPEKIELIEELRRRYMPSGDSPSPAARVLRTGEPELLSDVTPEEVASHTRDAEHASLIRRIGMRSHLTVPMIARGSIVGAISLGVTESDRRYGQGDLEFAMDLARRAALAVDNARLYDAAREELAERRRVEEALRLSEARFRAVVEQSPFSTQILRADGVTLRVNPAWEALWGITLEHVANYNVRTDPQLAERGVAPFIERAFSGEITEIPAIRYDPNESLPRRSRNDDSARWVRGFAYPLKNDGGEVREVVLLHEDVTQRVRTEEQRRASDERLRVLADAGESFGTSLDITVTLQNLARVLVPRVADWCAIDLLDDNGALERVTVMHTDPSRVALGMQVFRAYPPRRGAAFGAWHVLTSGTAEWAEEIAEDVLRGVAHDEAHYAMLEELGLVSYVCVPLIARGAAIGVLTLVYAESGRRFSEADVNLANDLARRAAAAVENARLYQRVREEDRRKDEFLATLAHELRNPLAPLRSGLEVLRAGVDARAAEHTRDVMQRQLTHMVRLVDDLLDVSRVTRGKIELRLEPLDLAALVSAALEVSQPSIAAAGLRLDVRLPSEPVTFAGDRTRLAQVLSNLLNNAAKYTPSGGRVEIDAHRAGDEVVIRVSDTGQGIPRELLTQVFDMFAQADHGRGGLGIGLTLARRLVELHGGHVVAESEGANRGSTFVVRLPAPSTAAAAAVRKESEAPPKAAGLRVLIVDDNADALELLVMLLALEGHDVRGALTGPEALELAPDFQPHVAFLDIGMPGMSGYELARHFREHPRLQRVRLVALTGWGQEEDRRRSHGAGFDAHYTKPIDIKDLQAVLADVYASTQVADSHSARE